MSSQIIRMQPRVAPEFAIRSSSQYKCKAGRLTAENRHTLKQIEARFSRHVHSNGDLRLTSSEIISDFQVADYKTPQGCLHFFLSDRRTLTLLDFDIATCEGGGKFESTATTQQLHTTPAPLAAEYTTSISIRLFSLSLLEISLKRPRTPSYSSRFVHYLLDLSRALKSFAPISASPSKNVRFFESLRGYTRNDFAQHSPTRKSQSSSIGSYRDPLPRRISSAVLVQEIVGVNGFATRCGARETLSQDLYRILYDSAFSDMEIRQIVFVELTRSITKCIDPAVEPVSLTAQERHQVFDRIVGSMTYFSESSFDDQDRRSKSNGDPNPRASADSGFRMVIFGELVRALNLFWHSACVEPRFSTKLTGTAQSRRYTYERQILFGEISGALSACLGIGLHSIPETVDIERLPISLDDQSEHLRPPLGEILSGIAARLCIAPQIIPSQSTELRGVEHRAMDADSHSEILKRAVTALQAYLNI